MCKFHFLMEFARVSSFFMTFNLCTLDNPWITSLDNHWIGPWLQLHSANSFCVNIKTFWKFSSVFGWLILKCNLTSKRGQCLPFSRRDLPSHGGILYLPFQLSIKSPSLHPVFGPAFTLLSSLSVVSTK